MVYDKEILYPWSVFIRIRENIIKAKPVEFKLRWYARLGKLHDLSSQLTRLTSETKDTASFHLGFYNRKSHNFSSHALDLGI